MWQKHNLKQGKFGFFYHNISACLCQSSVDPNFHKPRGSTLAKIKETRP